MLKEQSFKHTRFGILGITQDISGEGVGTHCPREGSLKLWLIAKQIYFEQ
jgi:hypothetical protein